MNSRKGQIKLNEVKELCASLLEVAEVEPI